MLLSQKLRSKSTACIGYLSTKPTAIYDNSTPRKFNFQEYDISSNMCKWSPGVVVGDNGEKGRLVHIPSEKSITYLAL